MDRDKLRQAIIASTPWWTSPEAFHQEAASFTERTLTEVLWHEIRSTPIEERSCHKVVMGPRRVGKTTLLKHLGRRIVSEGVVPPKRAVFLSLEDFIFHGIPLNEMLEDIEAITDATKESPAVLLLDEIIVSPSWAATLKRSYDEPHLYPFRIICTAGSIAGLRKGKIEGWGGRASEHFLMPAQISEAMNLSGLTPLDSHFDALADRPLAEMLRAARDFPTDEIDNSVWDLAATGGFPDNLYKNSDMSEEQKAAFMIQQQSQTRQFLSQVIEKDLPDYSSISYPLKAYAILQKAVDAPCGEMPRQKWADDETIALTPPTLDKYLKALDEAMLMFAVPNFSGPRKQKKLFFYDNSTPTSLGFRTPAQMYSEERGWSLENLVASSLKELCIQSLGNSIMYHCRDNGGEIDFVLQEPQAQPLSLEIGSSYTTKKKKIGKTERLLRNKKYQKLADNAYLCTPDAPTDRHGSIKYLPLAVLLVAIEARKNWHLKDRTARTGT